jgi:hypothetical protein
MMGKNKSIDLDHSPYLVALDDIFENANNNIDSNRPGFSPISGSEPEYNPKKWNNNIRIKSTHNCYAYVLDRILSGRRSKPQPGYYAGYPVLTKEDYKCDNFYERLKKDNPALYQVTFEDRCKKGFHKGFLALDDKESDQDYHFYIQNKSGYWSHKPGATDVRDVDASGKKIINPFLADRVYPEYKYNKPCFFFCLNPKLSKAHSNPNGM